MISNRNVPESMSTFSNYTIERLLYFKSTRKNQWEDELTHRVHFSYVNDFKVYVFR